MNSTKKIADIIYNKMINNDRYIKEVKRAREYNTTTLASFPMVFDHEYYMYSKVEFDGGREVGYLHNRDTRNKVREMVEKRIDLYISFR